MTCGGVITAPPDAHPEEHTPRWPSERRCHSSALRLLPMPRFGALDEHPAGPGVRILVQIRTRLQHLWAETFERVADRWGRRIRYGEPPSPPREGDVDSNVDGALRAQTVAHLQNLSLDVIAGLEALSSSDEHDGVARFRVEVEQALLEWAALFDEGGSDSGPSSTVGEP